MHVSVCTQVAKQAGRSLEFMKLSHNLAAVQRKKLDKVEAAYDVYKVSYLQDDTIMALHIHMSWSCMMVSWSAFHHVLIASSYKHIVVYKSVSQC